MPRPRSFPASTSSTPWHSHSYLLRSGNLRAGLLRWVGTFTLEVPGLRAETAHLTLSALASLTPDRKAGAHALAELFDELGRPDLGEAVEAWLQGR